MKNASDPSTVNVAKELKTGDPVSEQEWTKLFDDIKNSESLVYHPSSNNTKKKESTDQNETS